MKRPAIIELVLFVSLLTAGVVGRVWLQSLPNVAPVAAIAMFAGFYFRSWLMAAILPLAVMGISDYFIGGYDRATMLLIHAGLALPVACGLVLKRWMASSNSSVIRRVLVVAAGSLAGSCLFFLISNFATWIWSDMYEHSAAGLAHCYFNALPFFRETLRGDLFFNAVLFGGYDLATRLHSSRATRDERELTTVS